MKKIYLLLVLLSVSLRTFSQTETKHLKFEEIPIDGKQSEFIEKLISKNYRLLLVKREGKITLIGDYAEYKDCSVILLSSIVNDNMVGVIVEFPYCDTWTALHENYISQKNALQQIYGQPSKCTEKFLSDSLPNNDFDKIKNARFSTMFEHSTGTISLFIENNHVLLEYTDKINNELAYYENLTHSDTKIIQVPSETYKLFPTSNMWNFIKLNTRNGKMWQVQFDTGSDRFETILNNTPLVMKDEEENGRFTLYPTTNTFNFILLDQIDGRTWQVQWSFEKKKRMILPINDIPNKY